MKQLKRTPPPDCLNNSLAKSQKRNKNFYRDLWDKNGKIRPRWNTTCKDKKDCKTSQIRCKLFGMSDKCCAYCGKRLMASEMDVDHYLPSSRFPYLAYCWENLLPACKYCNQIAKGNYSPPSLTALKIGEDIVCDGVLADVPYNKTRILDEIASQDRLIDPTHDNPEDHLEFNPEFYCYEVKSEIGRITNEHFFHHKEVAGDWEKLSALIKRFVQDNAAEALEFYIDLHGQEFICREFYHYWLEEQRAGRIQRP